MTTHLSVYLILFLIAWLGARLFDVGWRRGERGRYYRALGLGILWVAAFLVVSLFMEVLK